MDYKVMIADDHLLFTEGLTKLINSIEGFRVVGSATNGEDLLRLLKGNDNPDLLLLDVLMPQLNGIETGKIINKLYPYCKILICTVYNAANIVKHFQAFKPHGLINKSIDAKKLEEVLITIKNGKTYFEAMPKTEIPQSENQNYNLYLFQKLTVREKEIVSLIKKGLSPKNIALNLKLSVNTVNNHKSSIFQKLGFNSVTEVMKFAYDANIE